MEGDATAESSSSLCDCLRIRLGGRFDRVGIEVFNRGHKQKWQSHLSTPAKRLPPAAKTCHDLPRPVRSDEGSSRPGDPPASTNNHAALFDLPGGPAVAESGPCSRTLEAVSGKGARASLRTVTVCHQPIIRTRRSPTRPVDQGQHPSPRENSKAPRPCLLSPVSCLLSLIPYPLSLKTPRCTVQSSPGGSGPCRLRSASFRRS